MTLKEFKKQAKATKINTNNAWGFGGRIATTYELGYLKYTTGQAYYRHSPPSRVHAYSYQGVTVTKGKFEELLKHTNNAGITLTEQSAIDKHFEKIDMEQ